MAEPVEDVLAEGGVTGDGPECDVGIEQQCHSPVPKSAGGAVDPANQWDYPRDGDAGPVDNDLLAVFHPLDSARQMCLSVMHVVVHSLGRHTTPG